MNRLLTCILLLTLLVTACTGGDKETIAMLDRAEALMEDYPDSAYTLLYNIDSLRIESDDVPTSLRARYYLLLGTAMNKTDRPMAFDSLFQHTVVDYYDPWGRPCSSDGTPYANGYVPSEKQFIRGYLSQEYYAEFGLLNLNARLYNPHIGRFLSIDPTF